MYEFKSRIPIDHVLALVANIRSGNYHRGENLILIGAITGELGALLASGTLPVVALLDFDETFIPATLDGCVLALEPLENAALDVEPQFDISPFIPIILKLIELWIARRNKS